METCFNYTDKTAYVSSDEKKWINKVRKLAEQRPDEVEIICQPEENDGCIYAKLPAQWLKINPKRVISGAELEHRREIARSLCERNNAKDHQ